jgi:outer membrane protein assembly factor BamD
MDLRLPGAHLASVTPARPGGRRLAPAQRQTRPALLPLVTACLIVAGLVAPGCGGDKMRVAPGSADPDKVLYERGMEALQKEKWITAREYFRQIVEGYPQSPVRADAKLGLGDTYLGERTTAAYILGVNEFREFLTFYPTHPRADYAQYKLAMCHFRQMAKAERDQTETKAAITEFEAFFERHSSSSLAPEARERYREARDRLAQSEYKVGLFYYRARWYPGAIDRFKNLLKADPEYTRRDAVYFHLAESLLKTDKKPEALPYYEKLVEEFESSEFLEEAKRRIAEIKAQDGTGG